MSDLTTPQGVFAYLLGTRFAATDVQRVIGGFSAFTYRVILSHPLEDGCTSIVLKHFESYVAMSPVLKLDAARSEFEYSALVALWDSGLVGHDSIVQAPRPIHYDRETHTILISDLGSDIIKLHEMLGYRLQSAYSNSDRTEIQAILSSIGSALGDFLGRLHRWSTASEHRQPFLHPHRRESLTSILYNLATRSASKFGVKEEWLEDMLTEELHKSSTDDQVLAMGDFSLNNILVHRVPDRGKLRVYVVDLEHCRPACPESDLSMLTGSWLSFAHYHRISHEYPFLPSLYKAYRAHYAVDRTRLTLCAGMHTMGLGTTTPWVHAGGDEIHKQITLLGYGIMKQAREGEDSIANADSPLKILFD